MRYLILLTLILAGCGVSLNKDDNPCLQNGTCIPTPPEQPTDEESDDSEDLSYDELLFELKRVQEKT